jgi:protein-disulfide isomerase
MASRAQTKAQARERRLAHEREAALQQRRTRRRQLAGGVVGLAVVIVAAMVLISSGGGGTSGSPGLATGPQAKATTRTVDQLLKGIPQSGLTLGRPDAPVTVTEYADLECPFCGQFATGQESELINRDVRAGTVKLVYRSLSTATGNGPEADVFTAQQSAAEAAGAQHHGWNYIETFYREQGSEATSYVTPSFLTGLAHQVTGLNLATWQHGRSASRYAAMVRSDAVAAARQHIQSTPTFVVSGPVSQTQPTSTLSYSDLESLIKSVTP